MQYLAVGSDQVPLTVARSQGASHTVAIVIAPSIFGIQPDLEAQMGELSAAGLVVAFDPFFRDGVGPIAYEDMPRVGERIAGLSPSQTRRDLRAAVTWAREQAGVQRVLMVGICYGGWLALLAAADGLVDGVVTWHGSRMEAVLERAVEIRCPMHHHLGGEDPIVPPIALQAIREALEGIPECRITIHAGVGHGFTHRQAPAAFDARAEAAAMASVHELAGRLRG